MSAKSNNVRIGIFVLVAVFLFIAGLLAFGARSYFVRKTPFETAIEGEVYGLSVGSKVELRGVPIGKVSRIDFALNIYPKTKLDLIVVEFEVDRHIYTEVDSSGKQKERLKKETAKGLRALIKSQGVTGTSILALEYIDSENNPPPSLDYTPRHLYVPSAPGQFTRILESIEKSLRRFQELDITSLRQTVSNVLSTTSQITTKLSKVDMEGISTNVNSLIVELRSTIKGMKLDTVSQDADSLMVGLKETNAKLQTVLDHVGAVPMQDTVSDVRSAVQTLNDVLLELKRYPSGFIFGQPPPPAKSVESPK